MKLKAIVFAAALMPVAGCSQQQSPPVSHGEVILPDDQVTEMRKLADAQAQRGALNDSTLYPCHFEGGYLNSLGMAKLDSMLKADCDPPLQVWLAVPDDDHLEARRMSVGSYLKYRGLSPEQVSFGKGANPDTSHPAELDLKNLSKTDTASDASASGGSGGSSAPPTPGATP